MHLYNLNHMTCSRGLAIVGTTCGKSMNILHMIILTAPSTVVQLSVNTQITVSSCTCTHTYRMEIRQAKR